MHCKIIQAVALNRKKPALYIDKDTGGGVWDLDGGTS